MSRLYKELPQTVTVLGHVITVLQSPLGDMEGEFDPNTMTIHIDSTSTSAKKWRALVHEQVHAALELTGVAQALEECTGSAAVEEIIVRVMETLIIQMVQKQGKLMQGAWAGEPGASDI